MRFISLDLEMDQPGNEIIQIGAASFDTDHGKLSDISIYVDIGREPNWDYVLNTGQTLKQLLDPSFESEWRKHAIHPNIQAFKHFWDWHKNQQCGKKIIQWGRGDTKLLVEQSQGCGYPSHLRVLDLKQVYRFIWQPSARLEKQSGLSRACENLKVDKPCPAHDALQDALATGYVFLKMFTQVSALANMLKDLSDD